MQKDKLLRKKQNARLRRQKWETKKRLTHSPVYAFVLKEHAQTAKEYLKTLS